MGFPKEKYQQTMNEAMSIMQDRDDKGRNDQAGFYEQFPHGSPDLTFECYRRTLRILGAEKKGDLATMRGDAIDLVNYAAFLVMLIDKELSTDIISKAEYIASHPTDRDGYHL